VIRFALDPTAGFKQVYPNVRLLLAISQTAAVMEILHAIFRVVRSPVATTTIQVFSRLFVLWGAVELGSKEVTESTWFVQMVTAWALSEIIRYAFYAVGLVVAKESIPQWLTWLRYSAFMILYPIGISGEMGCLYKVLPFVDKKKKFSITLPNTYNFAFDYSTFIWMVLFAAYPAGGYTMYTYMLSQRRKVLFPDLLKKRV